MKMELEKNCLSLLTGRRLTSGPSAEAGPALLTVPAPSPRPSSLATAQPTPARCLLLPSQARVDASDRVRHAAPRGERMPATPAGWRPVAPASTRLTHFQAPAAPLFPAFPIFPLPRCISPSPRPRHRSSADEIGHRWSTIARNRVHVTPPRSPTPGARCRVTV